jgi:phosphohistidine phosphatase
MKTLLLMRHAKSSWKDKEISDHERPLKKRGKKNASQMGELLKAKKLVPQKILTSTAERASKTAEILSESCHYKEEVEYLDALYMAEPSTIIEVLAHLPDEVDRVMVIGHNPGLESLAQTIAGKIISLPTAAIAHILLPVKTWKDLAGESGGQVVEIFQPKEK